MPFGLGLFSSSGPERMDYDVAYKQAEEMLSPKFDQQRQQLSRDQRQRGFYGQMPGDVMEQQLASQQTAQTGQFAQDLIERDFQMQMQEDEAGGGFWETVGGIAGGFLGGPGGAAIGSGIADWLF